MASHVAMLTLSALSTAVLPILLRAANEFVTRILLKFQRQTRPRRRSLTLTALTKRGALDMSYMFDAVMRHLLYARGVDRENVWRIEEVEKHLFPSDGTSYIVDEGRIRVEAFLATKNESTETGRVRHVDLSLVVSSKTESMAYVQNWVNKIKTEYLESLNEALKIQRYFKYTPNDNCPTPSKFACAQFKTNRTFHNMFFAKKDLLLHTLHRFEKDKASYARLGVPHTLGILMHGPPGTGKSSSIKALAVATKRHPVIIRLSQITTMGEMERIFTTTVLGPYGYIVPMDKRMYVFEEFDCNGAFKTRSHTKPPQVPPSVKRDPDAAGGKPLEVKLTPGTKIKRTLPSMFEPEDPVTLGGFLELLDGLVEMPGRMVVFTTNHKEKLDPALLRPGRIDLCVEYTLATPEDISSMYAMHFGSPPPPGAALPDKTMSHAAVNQMMFACEGPDDALKALAAAA